MKEYFSLGTHCTTVWRKVLGLLSLESWKEIIGRDSIEGFDGTQGHLLVSSQGALLVSKWFGVGIVCRMCREANNILSIDRLILLFSMGLVQVHFLRSQMIHMKVYYH